MHCKAGLGRTGTLIGAYLIYKHGFTASEGQSRSPLPHHVADELNDAAIGFMRLMRPGSCVGPQQHFLYENQMTWIKWSAVDQYKSTLPPSIAIPSPSKLARTTTPPPTTTMERGEPITPPHETALAITRSRNTTPIASTSGAVHSNSETTIGEVPKTPSRKIIVPGQPRKTPGKSKHSVATPETRPDDIAPLVLIASPSKEKVGMGMEVDGGIDPIAQGGEGVGEEEGTQDDEMETEPISMTARTPSTSRSKPIPIAPTSSRPTRIARSAKSRSKSAISDNRMVDKLNPLHALSSTAKGIESELANSPIKNNRGIGNVLPSATSTSTGGTKEMTRSRTVKKSLGTLFEGIDRTTAGGEEEVEDDEDVDPLLMPSSSGKSSRYALRAPAPLAVPASPSKLPQRTSVSRKRSAGSGTKINFEPELPSAPKIITRSGSGGGGFLENGIKRTDSDISLGSSMGRNGALGRSVRRRSSLGSVDFVAVQRD